MGLRYRLDQRLNQWPGEERPDIPLEDRIAEFLDLQAQIWAYDARQRQPNADPFDANPDDDVPF